MMSDIIAHYEELHGGTSMPGLYKEELEQSLGSLYYNEMLPIFSSNTTTMGNVIYSDFPYTFVYGSAVIDLYRTCGTDPIEVDSESGLTNILQGFFVQDRDRYPALWACNNRNALTEESGEKIRLSKMIHDWSRGLGIPYMGYIKQGHSYLSHNTQCSAILLPYMIKGRPVRMRNFGMSQKVIFDTTLDRACPVYFPPRLSK